ncbi:triacylglycerol lipase 2-like [Quercus suber]|uniref:triacylglycerol lipase 2-like n=1 Tax=Quercus suber TaxID=58331 RepID=UPI0032DE38A2
MERRRIKIYEREKDVGSVMDAAAWLFNSPNKSLAFILADNVFGAWISNNRGTESSRGHISLSTNDLVYWNWTWEQLASDDLLAMYDYILIYIIRYGRNLIRTGNTAKYDYGDESENKKHYGQPNPPLYNESRIPKDIPLFFGYGGKDSLTDVNEVKHLLDNLKDHKKDKLVVKYKEVYAHFDFVMAGNAKSEIYDPQMAFFRIQAWFSELFYGSTTDNSMFQKKVSHFSLNRSVAGKLLEGVCRLPLIDCSNLVSTVAGPNCCIKPSTYDVFLEHTPQSTSTKNVVHLSQMLLAGNIAKYDYGDDSENEKHYGQRTPPLYNLTRIPKDIPLFIGYGGKDSLSDVNDVKLLLDNLEDHQKDKLVLQYRDDYAHFDFVMAENAESVVYDPLLAFFRTQT